MAKKDHNFKKIQGSLKLEKQVLVADYECKRCDSIVRYPSKFSDVDVNMKASLIPNFPCIPKDYNKN